MKIEGKVFVVTGGGSGVGRALVLDLLRRGAFVAAVDINEKALEETRRLSGDRAPRLTVHMADISDRAAVEALPGQILAVHGAVDGVISNAGIIHPFLDVAETGYETVKKVLGVNFLGTLYMAKTFLPCLLARPAASLVMVSSAGALSPVPGETIYGASKAAVRLLAEGLRLELRETAVRVLVVFPGGISTNILDNSGVETDHRVAALRQKLAFLLLTPEKAARVILRGIEKNKRRLTPGIDAAVTDFLIRLSPVRAPGLIYRIIHRVLRLKADGGIKPAVPTDPAGT